MVNWARGEAERATRLDDLARALIDSGGSEAADYLQRVLMSRVDRLEQWVLMSMTTVDTEEIMPVVRKGVSVDDAETRAQAIEALETVGDRRVLNVLLPLIDATGGPPGMEPRNALRELCTDFDPWLRALAMRCLSERVQSDLSHIYEVAAADRSDLVQEIVPSLSLMTIENPEGLGVMDRVIALQRVTMFSDLDPEDLELLARSTSELTLEPGEKIYSEGTEGSEALMIVDGSAIVSVTRDGVTRVVNRYGPGESVGELALLRSGVRSADVHAGDEGLRAVVITKTDLMSTLEERPPVALGMLATLADRIVEET